MSDTTGDTTSDTASDDRTWAEILQPLDDAGLAEVRAVVDAEQARRARHAEIAAQIQTLAQEYVAVGGDPADLDVGATTTDGAAGADD